MELNLKVVEAFKELWNTNYREYIYYGGRYGAKNYSISQFLCTQALQKRQKFLILREFNTNNKGSVYEDIKSFFEEHEIETRLDDFDLFKLKYYNQARFITYKATRIRLEFNNSEFIFGGINDNVVNSLKGLRDINYCWIDEAEFLTEYSYIKLKPSIRAAGSKIIYSFNPERSESFLYQKCINNKDARCFVRKVQAAEFDSNLQKFVPKDNPFLNETILADIESDYRSLTPQMFAFVHYGQPYDIEDGNVINTDCIGFFNDKAEIRYQRLILTADTAFSKAENADFSVVCAFGMVNESEIHLIRLWRGRWDFNELQENVKGAYQWVFDKTKMNCERVVIEKKASGISLCQELQRTTRLPIKEIVPKTDKFARVSSVLSDFPKLRLPADRKNPYNSWIDGLLAEMRAFRADLGHLRDDQVDAVVYGLDYFKNRGVDWNKFL